MKATVSLNQRGVVTLPAKMRKQLGLQADDQLVAELKGGGILLRPAVTLPVEIYTKERIAEFKDEESLLKDYWASQSSN